jgi:hypothetical protein
MAGRAPVDINSMLRMVAKTSGFINACRLYRTREGRSPCS